MRYSLKLYLILFMLTYQPTGPPANFLLPLFLFSRIFDVLFYSLYHNNDQ